MNWLGNVTIVKCNSGLILHNAGINKIFKICTWCNVFNFAGLRKLNSQVNNIDFASSKVEKMLKDSLVSIPSPSSSVKIQIMGGECLLEV